MFQVQLFFSFVDYLGWWAGLLGLACKRLTVVTDETERSFDVRKVFQEISHVE